MKKTLYTFLFCFLFLFASESFGQAKDETPQNLTQKDSINLNIKDEPPSFPEGKEAMWQFLNQNILYPALAKESGIEGWVVVSFQVDTIGKISDIKILNEIGDKCGLAVVNAVKKMPKWISGKSNNQKVAMRYSLPVLFNLGTFDTSKGPPIFDKQ
jgi:TonB family protein